jgi:hypothetical protein
MRIDTPFAVELIENYEQNHWATINNACPSLQQNPAFPNAQDSRSVWFSLADLQNFISEFQQSGSQNALGVRIYFGEYSADIIAKCQGNPQYTGLHTLLMVPTLLGQDGFNHDFDPATGNSDFTQSATICALNHGGLMPPPFLNPASPQVINAGQDFMIFCDQNP